jgi:hypothetical protein
MDPELANIGAGMATIGMLSASAGPLIKSVGFANTEIIPAIKAATEAMTYEQVVMTGLAGGAVIGAVVGAYSMYSYS